MTTFKTIRLDLTPGSSLDFGREKEVAKAFIAKGFRLVFELDFALFKLKKQLSNHSQLLSLKLGLDHFKKTLFQEFEEKIEALILYQGHLNFAEHLIFDLSELIEFEKWSQKRNIKAESAHQDPFLRALFARDYCFSYLHLLTENQNFSLPFSIKLEANEELDPLLRVLLTHKSVCEPFQLVVNGLPDEKKSTIAFCLPSKDLVDKKSYAFFVKILTVLQEKKVSYRLIPEALLISDWDLVDYLFVLEETIKKEGRRKLAGFVAAGGIVVTEEKKLLLENEINFDEFLVDYF